MFRRGHEAGAPLALLAKVQNQVASLNPPSRVVAAPAFALAKARDLLRVGKLFETAVGNFNVIAALRFGF